MVIISLCEYLMRLVKKNINERYHKEIEIAFGCGGRRCGRTPLFDNITLSSNG
jgi:hypothetical protein